MTTFGSISRWVATGSRPRREDGYTATDTTLAVTVRWPDPAGEGTFYRRRERGVLCEWFAEPTGVKGRVGEGADILDALVLSHPVLGLIAYEFGYDAPPTAGVCPHTKQDCERQPTCRDTGTCQMDEES